MSLKDIKGQPFAVKLLKRALESNRMAHTYLFYGPEGVGKEFTARQFAKLLNCTEKTQDSCDSCSSCIRIDQNKHPDISWIYPTGKSRQIKIEQVRQLQKFISLKAYEGRAKVSIIVDAHTLNIEAGNALLKTLEEPPPNSVFVLVTHSPETLLPTIKSRTQDVQFFCLAQDKVKELLEKEMEFSKEEASFYSQLSLGSPGRALSLKDEDIFNQRRFILDILAKGVIKNMKELMDKVAQIQEGLEHAEEDGYRKQMEEILGLILSWYRDILIYKNTHKGEMVLNKDYMDRIQYWESRLDVDELIRRIGIVEDVKEALARQVNLKLLLQVMFVELGVLDA